MARKPTTLLLFSALVAIPLGCASNQPQQLGPESFMPKPPPVAAVASETKDPAPSPDNDPPKKAMVIDPPTTAPAAAIQPVDPAPEATLASATTRPTSPTAPPASAPVEPLHDGLYMTLGGVVAEVNGTPIYANQLLTKIDKVLSAKAREMDFDTFRAYARSELRDARDRQIADEVEYAAAQRLLTADDKKLIEQMAMPRFYQQKVTEAGGSVEQAKRKARAEGTTFDDVLEQEHRKMMQELLYQRRIIPRIQVPVGDMREFYDKNKDKLYTERAQAQFRVIKIDPKRIGGDHAQEDALKRIKVIREEALSGADFATLAAKENQDDYLRTHSGDPGGWMQKDSYRIDAVDKAIWQLKEPGQITDVIENPDDGALYIAKLEARKEGRVRPFDDQAVQDEIRGRLSQQQFASLHEQLRSDLLKEAVIRGGNDDSLLESAIDMAMQKYPRWAAR
jgi:parvulin-like peptidyl-prolyl isomerase